MLSRIAIAGKWALLYLSLSLPFVLIGQLFGGPTGAALGFLLGAVVFFSLCMLAEQIVFNAHRALGEPQAGLARTYHLVTESEFPLRKAPEIYVFPDPSPLALVAKNPGSQGMILLSQGVINTLNERDLRGLLGGCVKRAQSPRVALSTVAGVLTLALMRSVPAEWLDVFLGGEQGAPERRAQLPVLSALRLVAVLPLIRYLLFLGHGDRQNSVMWLGFAARRGARNWFRIRHPALFHLYLTG